MADDITELVRLLREKPDITSHCAASCIEGFQRNAAKVSPDPVVVRLEAELRVLQVGLAELSNRLLTLSCDPPRGYRLANQDSEWCLFDHRGECVEYGDTLEALVRKLGGGE